jgi:hypothetical protein
VTKTFCLGHTFINGKTSKTDRTLSVPQTKKSVIVDVVIVNSVMWAEGWVRGERGKSQRMGQLLPDRGQEWIGIRQHEQETGPPSKLGFLIIFARGSIKLHEHCVNIK